MNLTQAFFYTPNCNYAQLLYVIMCSHFLPKSKPGKKNTDILSFTKGNN